jgi:hypothetical protein
VKPSLNLGFDQTVDQSVDGYVGDESFSKRHPFDVDGPIANEYETRRQTLRLNAAGEIEAALSRPATAALSTARLSVDRKTAEGHAVKPRSGIAPRGDRKPSVYDGFGGGDDGSTASQKASPLPPTQAAAAKAFQPPATRDLSEITSRAEVKPSLNLGFDQSIGRLLLPDETRL